MTFNGLRGFMKFTRFSNVRIKREIIIVGFGTSLKCHFSGYCVSCHFESSLTVTVILKTLVLWKITFIKENVGFLFFSTRYARKNILDVSDLKQITSICK